MSKVPKPPEDTITWFEIVMVLSVIAMFVGCLRDFVDHG